MADSVVRWVGAGLLTVGLSSATLLGAGVAGAEPGEGSDGGGQESSQASDSGTGDEAVSEAGIGPDSVDSQPDSKIDTEPPSADIGAVADADDVDDPDADSGAHPTATITGRIPAVDPTTNNDAPGADDPASRIVRAAAAPVESGLPDTAADDRVRGPVAAPRDEPPTPEPVPSSAPAPASSTVEAGRHDVPQADVVSAVAAAAPQAPPAQPTLINIIGTVFFTLLDFVVKLTAGPPAVPPTGAVRVGRGTLQIDCGDGYTTDADWYVPTSQEPPQGLIYFQHGFATQPGFYNVTASRLAESTNSIVVVPSITSNFFACDACHLTGDPMHFAVAKLFSGDRAALRESLAAAFPDEDIALPRTYVLAGHSGGSSFAAAVAGFASQLAGSGGSPDLAGVVLYDTNDIGEFVSRGIAKVPAATPVYYIAADPALINNFDQVTSVLQTLRPDAFVGVHLLGGVHADALAGTNPVVGFIAGLALGFPTPENAAAAHLLAAGWITDMFSDGADSGFYPAAGATADLDTGAGTARLVDLRAPAYQPSPVESLIALFYGQIGNFRFGTCAADVDALLAQELETNTATTRGRDTCRT